jgi:hypothetical protein
MKPATFFQTEQPTLLSFGRAAILPEERDHVAVSESTRGAGPREAPMQTQEHLMDVSQTLMQTWPRERLRAAMCVQDVDVQCVLQFTLSNAASCALHRLASRVIHRSEVGFDFAFFQGSFQNPFINSHE